MNRRRTKEEVADEGGDDDDEAAANIYVTSFSSTGFKLSNTYGVVGPCILFPRTILSWNVANAKDITPESLTLFSLLEPKLDVLVLGIGQSTSCISFVLLCVCIFVFLCVRLRRCLCFCRTS